MKGAVSSNTSRELATVFHVRESQAEVEKRIAAAREPVRTLYTIKPAAIATAGAGAADAKGSAAAGASDGKAGALIDDAARRASDDSFYREVIDIPLRPAWKPAMKPEQVRR
jgi:hypothetical protein